MTLDVSEVTHDLMSCNEVVAKVISTNDLIKINSNSHNNVQNSFINNKENVPKSAQNLASNQIAKSLDKPGSHDVYKVARNINDDVINMAAVNNDVIKGVEKMAPTFDSDVIRNCSKNADNSKSDITRVVEDFVINNIGSIAEKIAQCIQSRGNETGKINHIQLIVGLIRF